MKMLPAHLKNEISEGRAVLILGAGASRDSRNRAGGPVALAKDLAAILAEAAGLEFHNEPLDDVVQATSETLGKHKLQTILEREFKDVVPSNPLRQLLSFPWRRIYTLNLDDSLENIPRSNRRQRLVFFNALCDRTCRIRRTFSLSGNPP